MVNTYSEAFAKSLVLHVIVAVVVFFSSLQLTPKKQIIVIPELSLVTSPKPVSKPPKVEKLPAKIKKKKSKPPKAKPKKVPKPKPKSKPKPKPKSKVKPTAKQQQAKVKAKTKEITKPTPKIVESEQPVKQQEKPLPTTQSETKQEAVTEQGGAIPREVGEYSMLIKREIERNWSRPLSARNGMSVELKIRILPDGEVIDVVVIRSSGNEIFDRSAILAVSKARILPIPEDIAIYQKYFRQLILLFNPQDLSR